MKRQPILIILCFGMSFYMACKKDGNISPTAQKIQKGIWKISGSEIIKYMGRDTSLDFYSKWRACEQDDVIVFEKDGSATTNENANKCEEDNQINHLKWELTNNDTRLKIKMGNGGNFSNGVNMVEYEIVAITDKEMKLKSDGTINTVPATTIETYKNID